MIYEVYYKKEKVGLAEATNDTIFQKAVELCQHGREVVDLFEITYSNDNHEKNKEIM